MPDRRIFARHATVVGLLSIAANDHRECQAGALGAAPAFFRVHAFIIGAG